MTVDRWLAERDGTSPEVLAARVRALAEEGARTAAGGEGETSDPVTALVNATARVLERLLREHETARASALELLAADALATYAMEAQGDHPASLEARCAWAMRYFSGIADSA